MDKSRNAVYFRAATLAVAAGLRSQLPLALLTRASGRGDIALPTSGPFSLFRSRFARIGSVVGAAGELIADKTPNVPSRIDPAPLAGRLVLGGLTAAVFAKGNNRPAPLAFVIGAAAAGLGSFAGYYARSGIKEKTGLSDFPVAVAEDLVAFGIASLAIGS